MEVVEFALGVPSLLMGEVLENIARGIDCEAIRQPLGVCVGITPFNFPAMVPLWMYPIASPGEHVCPQASEKVPLTAIRLSKLFEKAGLPKGVLNIVHGGREVVDALLTHPKVKAISFVGSTPIARHIYEIGTKHGKRVQSNGGAKNYVFIMPDADVENSTRGVIEAAFGCAGERCMAGSTAVVIGDADKTVLPSLLEATRNQNRPDGPRNAAGHGPGHHAPASRPCPAIDRSRREGRRENSRRWSRRESHRSAEWFFLGATVLDHVQNGMTVAREEIFGPVLNVMRFADLDAAIELANRSPYGNGASIFTRSGKAAREFKHRVKAGMVGVNIGVPASMAWFPFNGWDESFFGDLHMQGKEGVQFFTQQKVTMTRWFSYGEGDIWQQRKNNGQNLQNYAKLFLASQRKFQFCKFC